MGRAFVFLDGGFDSIPEIFFRLLEGKQLTRSFRNCLQISQQGTAAVAALQVWMHGCILAGADQICQLGLEVMAAEVVGVPGHCGPSLRKDVRSASRSFKRALCNCDLLLPMEQSSILAISLCS